MKTQFSIKPENIKYNVYNCECCGKKIMPFDAGICNDCHRRKIIEANTYTCKNCGVIIGAGDFCRNRGKCETKYTDRIKREKIKQEKEKQLTLFNH